MIADNGKPGNGDENEGADAPAQTDNGNTDTEKTTDQSDDAGEADEADQSDED